MSVREWKKPLDQRYMLRARARRAQAEDINDVVRLSEAMLSGNVFGPLFYGIRLDFNGCSALTADQVVVVRVWGAGAEQALAVLLQRVGVTGSGKICQGPVHGGKTDGATRVAQRTVERLSAHETL